MFENQSKKSEILLHGFALSKTWKDTLRLCPSQWWWHLCNRISKTFFSIPLRSWMEIWILMSVTGEEKKDIFDLNIPEWINVIPIPVQINRLSFTLNELPGKNRQPFDIIKANFWPINWMLTCREIANEPTQHVVLRRRVSYSPSKIPKAPDEASPL